MNLISYNIIEFLNSKIKYEPNSFVEVFTFVDLQIKKQNYKFLKIHV